MSDIVLKVPLGPETVLHGREIGAFFRHRYMIFLYFAGALVGVIGSMGNGDTAPVEIRFGQTALKVWLDVVILLAVVYARVSWSRRRGVAIRLHLGRMILIGTVVTIAVTEAVDVRLQGHPPTALKFLLAQVVFYNGMAQLLFSAGMKFALDRMLSDLRGAAAGDVKHARRDG